MMVRDFLRIRHLGRALLLGAAVSCIAALTLSAQAGATERGVSAEINRFLMGYTRDLEQRLGAGARVTHNFAATAATEARSCALPPAISAKDTAPSQTRVTLLVACGSEWSIYVPVDLDVHRPVVVALRPLASGAVIAADDVELSALDVSQLSGTYLTGLDEAIGMSVKRPIAPGRPIVSQQLEPPLLIRRGESVVISAESGELAVKMTGTALTDGRRGELIRVKNQTSSRVIDARVVAPGQVTVPM